MDQGSNSVPESISPFDCLLFDLNDTLYPSSIGLAEAMERKIEEFLVLKCGIAEDKASNVREDLFLTYGTTLAGLKVLGFEVDEDYYHDFVLPIEVIKPDPVLRTLLRSIKQRKFLFTGSRRRMAIKILERLGVQDCFDGIICFETLNRDLLLLPESDRSDEFPSAIMKPSVDAMKIALDVAGADPHRTLFLDNEEENIAAGKIVGFRTVLVGKVVKSNEADYVVEGLADLRQVVPEIWACVELMSKLK